MELRFPTGSFDTLLVVNLSYLLAVIHDDHTHHNTLSIDVNATCASMKRTDVLDNSLANTRNFLSLLVLVPTDNSKQ